MPDPYNAAGAVLDPALLDRELARRGLRQKDLARLSGLTEALLSRARHGRPVRPRTLARIAAVLAAQPVLEGVDLVLAAPAAGTSR